jgi:hypothetical protein
MSDSLPNQLKLRVEESRPRLEGSGFTLETFDALERAEKKSFGVYAERGAKGFHLTAWDSREVQVSAIDYDVDPSPAEKYLSDVNEGELGREFEDLVDWASGTQVIDQS